MVREIEAQNDEVTFPKVTRRSKTGKRDLKPASQAPERLPFYTLPLSSYWVSHPLATQRGTSSGAAVSQAGLPEAPAHLASSRWTMNIC